MNSTDSGPIHCLQFISMAHSYLLPSCAMVDIVPWQSLMQAKSQHHWLLGHCSWQGFAVPIINLQLEAANMGEPTKLTRILMVMALGRLAEKVPYVGTMIAQLPKPIQISPQMLEFWQPPTVTDLMIPVEGHLLEASIVALDTLSEQLADYDLSPLT
jgi:chemotaxis signal transduction protein